MAERKRPRQTRERILETSLLLFNRLGAPHVTTADIAGEMNISPGNLYYHFRNRDQIVAELYAAFETRLDDLLGAPEGRLADVEDLWLFLHLLFEAMWEFRFLYRDLDEILSRDRRLASRFTRFMRRGAETMIELCRSMVVARAMQCVRPRNRSACPKMSWSLRHTGCRTRRSWPATDRSRHHQSRSRRLSGAVADRAVPARQRPHLARPAQPRLSLIQAQGGVPWLQNG